MRAWRKVYSKLLDSPSIAALSDGAIVLLLYLIVAQDDSGYYPWDPVRVRRVTVTRPSWSHDVAMAFAQEIVTAGIASWQDSGIMLTNGAAMNGRPRKDVDTDLYQRQHGVDATSTSRQHGVDATFSQSRVEQSRAEQIPPAAQGVQGGAVSLEKPAPKKTRTTQPKPRPSVSDEFISRMVADYATLWPEAEVRERITLALDHDQARKYTRHDLYVQNWLRRDAGKAKGTNGVNPGYPPGHTPTGPELRAQWGKLRPDLLEPPAGD